MGEHALARATKVIIREYYNLLAHGRAQILAGNAKAY